MFEKSDIGHRFLISYKQNGSVNEYSLIDISPSGNYVKLQRIDSEYYYRPNWEEVMRIKFIERLQDKNGEY